MRLCLNREQSDGIYRLLDTMLKSYTPESIQESLVDDFIASIREKLRKKLEVGYAKEWSITLSSKEAKAYFSFFNREQALPEGFEYELNLVKRHINEIDEKYTPYNLTPNPLTKSRLA